MKKALFISASLAVLAVPRANAAVTDVVINEIQFDPVGGDNSTTQEWFELYNTGTDQVDLAGVVVDAGAFSQFTFPANSIIAGNGYVVLTANKPEFLASNLGGVDAGIVYDLNLATADIGSKLANSTANISLTESSAGAPFDTVTYTKTAPWPDDAPGAGANSTGKTLELVDATADNDDGANWLVSVFEAGSPGKANSVAGQTKIYGGQRDVEFPSPSQPITVNATILTSNSLTSAQIYVDSGSGYLASPLVHGSGDAYSKSLGTFPDKTLVKYYIKAVDSTGYEITYPDLAPGRPAAFHVDSAFPSSNDLVINEILYNPSGYDNGSNSEYVEFYNRSASAIDMSFFVWGRKLTDTYRRVFPEGTVIPAHGYLVGAGRKELMTTQFPSIDPAIINDASWTINVSVLANGGSTVFLAHANAFEWNNLETVPIDIVNYSSATPWPSTNGKNSIELIDATSDNDDGSNWAATTETIGTPGATNSVSAVNDWNLY